MSVSRLIGCLVVVICTAASGEIGLAAFAPEGIEILPNGDFEIGPTVWTQFSAQGLPLILDANDLGVPPHGGSWGARLGGVSNETAYIEQTVVVPESSPGAPVFLYYWHWILSLDTCGFDLAYVLIDGGLVDSYDLCVSAQTGDWVTHNVNLSAFAGQTVAIQIRVETDAALISDLFVDDVYFDFSPIPCFALTLSHTGNGVDPVAAPPNSTGCSVSFFHAGEAIGLTASPDPGWEVESWSGTDNDPSTSETNTLTMPADAHTASVNYVESAPRSWLLLVDDDDNAPDVRPEYSAALDSLGVLFDVWDTNNSDLEPDAATLGQYTAVLWFTGAEFGGFAGPGPAGEASLASFLDDGGCLIISSQDYLLDRGLTGFMTSHLGVGSATNDVNHTVVTGQGSVFGGLGPYPLSGPFPNASDLLSPDGSAELAFFGNNGDAAVAKDSGFYRTAFLGFPVEFLAPGSSGEEVLAAGLAFCTYIFADGFESGDTSAWSNTVP